MKKLAKTTGLLACLLVPGLALAEQVPLCHAIVQIKAGTKLKDLAARYFADIDYRHAIMLATNRRAGDDFPFIADPNKLPKGAKICIPGITEATQLRNRFLTYLDAMRDMALPEVSEITDKLDPVDASKPVVMLSWVRIDQAAVYKANLGKVMPAFGNFWVTLVPKLKNFCKQFVKNISDDPQSLTIRLEQRLGLPPNSAKKRFIELEVVDPGEPGNIFRPCASPDVTTTTCALGPPKNCKAGGASAISCSKHNTFFFRQYYASYGVAVPTGFPWTSLGYTFDWAFGDIGLGGRAQFVKFGESEYVIAKGAKIIVKGVYKTADYCRPE